MRSVLALPILLAGVACADDSVDQPRVVPTPLQDDATLHDLTFVGSRFGWAVGDHGVVWHTADGGGTWRLLPTPTQAPLRSVCFLTNRVGWVAGGAAISYSTASSGVLLFTRDGGETWERLAEHDLPRLNTVRFHGLERGIVVGTSTAANPSGVWITSDGGRSWQPVDSGQREAWRSAAFGAPGSGVLVGKQGRVALFAEGRLLEARIADLGLRSIRAATMTRDDAGWIVGDGGLVLHTGTGGVSWNLPATEPPPKLVQRFDFDAVAQRGSHVWMAGSPGSVVWHSPDDGRMWEAGRTGQPAPILDLHFTSDATGFAVGAFGAILRTDDGGTSWTAVRGGDRRSALLAVHAHPQRVSFRLLARESAEQGYRSAVLVAARHDVGPNARSTFDADNRLTEATVLSGGAIAETGWQLPLDLPNLDTQHARLLAEWNRRTEGRLEDALVGRMVVAIRTWRPNVVVLDDPPPNDEATKLVNAAVMQAIERAADPTRDLALVERLGLEPWRVRRVFARVAEGSSGDVNLEAYEPLHRVGASLVAAAGRAENLVTPTARPRTGSHPHGFRLLRDFASNSRGATPSFFAGLVLTPCGPARRFVPQLDPAQLERDQMLVTRQRNVHAYAERAFDDPRRAANMLAELDGVLRGMPDAQAAELLLTLGREHRVRARWDEAEETFVELVRRYPDEPVTREAVGWLFHLWTSAETAWQRSRRVGTRTERRTTNRDGVVARFEQAIRLASHEQGEPDAADLAPHADPWQVVNSPGAVVNSGTNTLANGYTWGDDWRSGTVRHWQRRAAWIASFLKENAPETFRTPEVQFALATLYRQRQVYVRADEIHRRFATASNGSAWQGAAESEVWMQQPTAVNPSRKIARCVRTAARPHLDGELSDPCWQAATAVPLSPGGEADRSSLPFAMFCYDDRYLYVAASLPSDPRLPADGPSHAGRTHDADLDPFDRLAFLFDVDRDYATHYTFEVDQRGWTRDACWEDRSWNPRWHVAAEHDRGRWFAEIAIPFEELVPAPPSGGHAWALGIVRTKPAIGVETWTDPPTALPRPETFGLLRFE